MTPLQQRLLDRIAAHGPMPFAAFMSIALYDPQHGYYATGERTGWQGDFVTSAELDPAFGGLWARAFERVWERCGSPADFEIVEIGPGEGGFAAAVLDALQGGFADAVAYRLVERMGTARRRQEERLATDERVRWSASVTDLEKVDSGVVFANEVLDNLPVHLVEKRDGRIVEVCVDRAGNDLVEVFLPPSNPELAAFFERHGTHLPDGHRAEVTLAAESFCARAAGAVRQGAVVLVDYGGSAAELVTHPRGTLVCYSPAGPDDAPLDRPGEKDITAHANWGAVAHSLRGAGMDVSGPRPQREVLLALGLADLDAELRDTHDSSVQEGRGVDAVAALSRRHALRALSDRDGLGGLSVVVGYRAIAAPDFVA